MDWKERFRKQFGVAHSRDNLRAIPTDDLLIFTPKPRPIKIEEFIEQELTAAVEKARSEEREKTIRECLSKCQELNPTIGRFEMYLQSLINNQK